MLLSPWVGLTLLLTPAQEVAPEADQQQAEILLEAEDWHGLLALLAPPRRDGAGAPRKCYILLKAALAAEEPAVAERAADELLAALQTGADPAEAEEARLLCLGFGRRCWSGEELDTMAAWRWFRRAWLFGAWLPASAAGRASTLYFALAEQELGHYLEAESLLLQASSDARAAGDDLRSIEADRLLATLLVDVGRLDEAAAWYRVCVESAALAGLREPEIKALVWWAWNDWDLGRADEAEGKVEALLAREAELDPFSLRMVRTLQAEIACRSGRTQDARVAVALALAALTQHDPPERRILPMLALARADLVDRDFAAVAAGIAAVAAILEVPETANRSDGAAYQRARYADCARLAQDLAAVRTAEASDAEERHTMLLRGWSEIGRWKARGILDRIALADAGRAPPSAAEWAAVLSARRPDATLLEYSFGQERLYVWRWHRGEVELLDLGPRVAIQTAVRRYREVLADPALAATLEEIVTAGGDLYQLLAARCLPPDCTTLIVAPDGEIAGIPFGALIRSSEGPAAEVRDFGQVRFLAEDLPILHVPAASVWARLATIEAAVPGAPRGVFVLADPIFPDGRWPALPGTAREAEMLRALRPAALVLTGAQATREAFLGADFRKCGIVHLATHGWVHHFDPRHSRIACAGSGAESDLRLADVLGCSFGGSLVVLSACDTGGGMVLRGEGVQSLASAFLRAGAGGVVASLWPVRDAETTTLMSRFYGALLEEDASPDQALRRASVELARRPADGAVFAKSRGTGTTADAPPPGGRNLTRGPRSAPLQGHPGIWAPFVYYGSGSRPPPSR
jgi:CHAT domain-containing protein